MVDPREFKKTLMLAILSNRGLLQITARCRTPVRAARARVAWVAAFTQMRLEMAKPADRAV